MPSPSLTANGTVPGEVEAGQVSRPEKTRPALVLLVDDYADCRDMYGAGLEFAGFLVLTAHDGLEALRVARRTRPDIILMDLGLPGIDGCEATRLLKQDPATSSVPVIALTAQPLPSNQSMRSLGFEDVITKPCLPDTLADLVARAIRRCRDHRRVS